VKVFVGISIDNKVLNRVLTSLFSAYGPIDQILTRPASYYFIGFSHSLKILYNR